jgi:hypothetical protein
MRHMCATDAPEVRHCGQNFSAVLTVDLGPCLTLGLIVGASEEAKVMSRPPAAVDLSDPGTDRVPESSIPMSQSRQIEADGDRAATGKSGCGELMRFAALGPAPRALVTRAWFF